jgi:hypothetical protein
MNAQDRTSKATNNDYCVQGARTFCAPHGNSFAAIEAEEDGTALKTKLAEYGSLLKELQTRVQAQSHMLDMMQHHMTGGAMMGEDKSAEHKN